jgi:hypothetical protein
MVQVLRLQIYGLTFAPKVYVMSRFHSVGFAPRGSLIKAEPRLRRLVASLSVEARVSPCGVCGGQSGTGGQYVELAVMRGDKSI